MRELVVLMLIAVALAWCADHVTVRPLNGKKSHRQMLFSIALFVLLAGFVGLRNGTTIQKHIVTHMRQ